MKFYSTFFYPIYQNIKNPKYLNFDSFWNVYYLNKNLLSNLNFCLKLYNHSCINEKKCNQNYQNIYNSDLQIIYNKKEFNEKILFKEYESKIIIENYLLQNNNKLNIINHFEIIQYFHIYMFINKVEDYLLKNIPGKTIWTKEQKKQGLQYYQQLLFYLQSIEKSKKIGNELLNIFFMNNKSEPTFQYHQKIRFQMIQDLIQKNSFTENEFLVNKLVYLIQELDILYE